MKGFSFMTKFLHRHNFYYYPVEYGSPHHPSFAFTLCSEFSTVPPAQILNWYLCAFNLYVSPLSVALENYKPTRDLNPLNITTKALQLSDSAVSDYETFVSKSKTDPSFHGWFSQSDFTIESVAELFTSNIDADDRQTIETVNIFYLCLLTLAMCTHPKTINYLNWMETTANELKALLQKESCCKLFPTLGDDSKSERLRPMFETLERFSELRTIFMKSFIDLVFACRDGTTTSSFFSPYDYVIKQLEYSNISHVPQIKAKIIDVSHPIRHASFIKKEAFLFDDLEKHLNTLGRYGPYAQIIKNMPCRFYGTSFPNLLAACRILSLSDERFSEELDIFETINQFIKPLLEAIDLSNDKFEELTANQVLQMEIQISKARVIETAERATKAEDSAKESEDRALEAHTRAMEAHTRVVEAEARATEAEARATEAEARAMEAETRAMRAKGRSEFIISHFS